MDGRVDMQQEMLDPERAGRRWGMASVPTRDQGVATFAMGHGDVWKMLRYDIERLVMKGGIWTMFDKGTIMTTSKMPQNLLKYPLFALVFWFVSKTLVEEKAEVNAQYPLQLVKQLSKATPFVLGMYLSLVLARWWALRTQALGEVLDSTTNVTLILYSCLPEEQWDEAKFSCYRWCIAGVHLLVKACRDIKDIDDLEKEGYLTAEEAAAIELEPLDQRPHVPWAWVGRAIREAQQEGALNGRWAGACMKLVTSASDGIDTVHTYMNTQLPFAYVHLITLMVSLTNFATAFKCGMVLGKEYAEAVEAGTKVDRLVFFNECFFVIVVPLVYDGLLSLSYMIHDPFGSDILDFPVTAYLASVVDNCSAVQYAQTCYPGAFTPEIDIDKDGLDKDTKDNAEEGEGDDDDDDDDGD